jgi:antitoxin (DNA-binding transcriptional repressor) of toxin-antitoxin stability system
VTVNTTMDIRELPSRLDEAIAVTSAGGEVTLTDGAIVRARLVPVKSPATQRTPGLHAGAIQASPDFDSPLPDDFWTGRE